MALGLILDIQQASDFSEIEDYLTSARNKLKDPAMQSFFSGGFMPCLELCLKDLDFIHDDSFERVKEYKNNSPL